MKMGMQFINYNFQFTEIEFCFIIILLFLFCTKGYLTFNILCNDKRSVCINLLHVQQQFNVQYLFYRQYFKVVLLSTQKLISIEKYYILCYYIMHENPKSQEPSIF